MTTGLKYRRKKKTGIKNQHFNLFTKRFTFFTDYHINHFLDNFSYSIINNYCLKKNENCFNKIIIETKDRISICKLIIYTIKLFLTHYWIFIIYLCLLSFNHYVSQVFSFNQLLDNSLNKIENQNNQIALKFYFRVLIQLFQRCDMGD